MNRKAVAHYNPRLNPTLDPLLLSLYEETAAAREREIERDTQEWVEKRRQKCLAQEEEQRDQLRERMRHQLGLI